MEITRKITLWITRIVTTGVLGLVSYIILAHVWSGEMFDGLILKSSEIIALMCMVSMLVGGLMTYKWKLEGGIVMAVSYVVFAVHQGSIWLGPVFPFFLFIGIANIALWWWERRSLLIQ